MRRVIETAFASTEKLKPEGDDHLLPVCRLHPMTSLSKSDDIRLGIDARMWMNSGIGCYLRNLLPRIARSHFDWRFEILVRPADLSSVRDFLPFPNVDLTPISAPIYSLAEQCLLPMRIGKKLSLFWSPHYNIPMAYRGRLLVTVHDALPLALPETYDSAAKRWVGRKFFERIRRHAWGILADSQFSRDELVQRVGVAAERIAVCHLGVDAPRSDLNPGPAPHPRPYLLFIGNVKPHKNLPGLLTAYRQIMDLIPHDLVIIGQHSGLRTADKRVTGIAASLAGRVKLAGAVDDELLHRFLAHATLLVQPSFYEGFGLPPLEAMAAGCPTLVARAGALPEVCGDATAYCDPHDPTDIANAILRLVNDPSELNQLRAAGREHVKRYSWDATAACTVAVIERALAA